MNHVLQFIKREYPAIVSGDDDIEARLFDLVPRQLQCIQNAIDHRRRRGLVAPGNDRVRQLNLLMLRAKYLTLRIGAA